MVRSRESLVLLLVFLLGGTVPGFVHAQDSTSNLQRIEELARQLEATQIALEQTQSELQTLREHGTEGQPAHSSVAQPDPLDAYGLAGEVAAGCDAGPSGASCCPDCGKQVCQGLPHLCAGCKDQLSWNKGKFRVVPFGNVVGEMLGSERSFLLRGSPLYLVPGPAPGINDRRYTVSGQQTTIGLSVTGPDLGPFKSGANVAVNFFGERPILNNPGLFFLFAYAELKNEDWRFWIGQAPDAIGRQNTNSPAFSSHKMSGNFGQLRPGFRVERFFHPSEMWGASLYLGLTQQGVNDFVAVPGVSGVDNGWPNVEARWETTLGPQQQGKRPILFAVGGLIGETRAIDDFALSAGNASTSWAVIPEFRVEFERWGFQSEGFVGDAMGSYNGAIGQTLNPETGEAIYSAGVFGELFWKMTPCFTTSIGYGIDDPRDSDLGRLANGNLGQRARNEKYWWNFIWKISDEWETRFEVSHLETKYLAPTNDSDSMIYHFLLRYSF